MQTPISNAAVARATRLRLRAEGRAAFAGQDVAPTPPYPPQTQACREWLHGWWTVHYGHYCAACGDKHHVQRCAVVREALFAADPPDGPPIVIIEAPTEDCPEGGPQ